MVFDDVMSVDPELHQQLQWLLRNEGVTDLELDFTVMQEVFGSTQVVELKPGGASIDVTDSNKAEYVTLKMQYMMLGGCSPQLRALLCGFYDVVPIALAR